LTLAAGFIMFGSIAAGIFDTTGIGPRQQLCEFTA